MFGHKHQPIFVSYVEKRLKNIKVLETKMQDFRLLGFQFNHYIKKQGCLISL